MVRIHITGRVQGVGFRPFIVRSARKFNLHGTVANGSDGVHITAYGTSNCVESFIAEIRDNPPEQSLIHSIDVSEEEYDGSLQSAQFKVEESHINSPPSLLITPDLDTCEKCLEEFGESSNRREGYAFITCTDCGPRFSITNALPFDRQRTSMEVFQQCPLCLTEYTSYNDRRFFSQTNSCPQCGVSLWLERVLESGKTERTEEEYAAKEQASELLKGGHILAVKGIGGYILLADATNSATIQELRKRKQRPSKPFAVMFANMESLQKYGVMLSAEESSTLQSNAKPIVIVQHEDGDSHQVGLSNLAFRDIVPSGGSLGVFLPYTPLFHALCTEVGKPLVATSGNISGSPIFYDDTQAINNLSHIADAFLINNRKILIPQDDSVVRYSPLYKQKIILRRSRGLSPSFPIAFNRIEELPNNTLAMGAMLKSTFAMTHQNNLYISQYLGDLQSFDTELEYRHTLLHLTKLLQAQPQYILIDKHPEYSSSKIGREVFDGLREQEPQTFFEIQEISHHEAHAAAIIWESELMNSNEKVLCVTWDGIGFGGMDKETSKPQMWGSEFFVYQQYMFQHVGSWSNFPYLLGDAMAHQPRLSALAILHKECCENQEITQLLQEKFSPVEWSLYRKMLQNDMLQTSSMGRIFDAVACLLGCGDAVSYEGEDAMKLEMLAQTYFQQHPEAIEKLEPLSVKQSWDTQGLLREIALHIIKNQKAAPLLAAQFHRTIVESVFEIATHHKVSHIAFSGGVMQNALLIDLLHQHGGARWTLHFHREVSPNDECISLGQIAHLAIARKRERVTL